ncbi:MAG: hypothetical protein LWW95_08145 [Candidatus Desulfofervidus auxilii]|nr:hypothetical protein [Candidatus Desulfofervidus auxilii]
MKGKIDCENFGTEKCAFKNIEDPDFKFYWSYDKGDFWEVEIVFDCREICPFYKPKKKGEEDANKKSNN